jgi:hypothetical protein
LGQQAFEAVEAVCGAGGETLFVVEGESGGDLPGVGQAGALAIYCN